MILKVNFPLDIKYYLTGMSSLHIFEKQDKYLARSFRTTVLKMSYKWYIQATNTDMKRSDQQSVYYGKDNIYN